MSSQSQFVQLDRRFHPFTGDGDVDEIASESVFGRFLGRERESVGWEDILSICGVRVILGEPGSGRTEEFRHQRHLLIDRGEASFYIPLHELAHKEIDGILLDRDLVNFRSWKRGRDRCWIFLDAVDEAKLESNRAWEAALKNAYRSIGREALEFTTILISCRVHQWDPILDPRRIEEAFNLTQRFKKKSNETSEDADTKAKALEIFLLEPLDEIRIRKYAGAFDTENVNEFVEAIRKNHCWEFAGRPYDVKFLLSYWRSRGQLGALSEMIDHLVDHQLTEHRADSRRVFDIPKEKLRDGAETLAAASILCNCLHFSTSTFERGSGRALLPSSCMPGDWSEMEVETLLDRPLFTASSLGKIRFHHRRTTEYLAVCWIQKRSAELSNLDLNLLFFSRYHGKLWIRESRESVSTWLACLSPGGWGRELRSKLIRISPDSFFRKGDPAELPSKAKVEIIDSFVAQYARHDVLRLSTEESVVARIGDAIMAARLAHHLLDINVPPGVKIEILGIATTLHLKECLPAALALIGSGSNRLDLPGYAINLIEACGGPDEIEELSKLVHSIPSMTPYLAASLVSILFPERMKVSTLEDLIRKSVSSGEKFFLEMRIREKIDEASDRTLLVIIAQMLIRLIYDEKRPDNEFIDSQFRWLVDSLATVFNRLCAYNHHGQAEIEILGLVMWILRRPSIRHSNAWTRNDNERFDVDKLTQCHPPIRRVAFWREVEFQRRAAPRKTSQWTGEGRDVYFYDLNLTICSKDLIWALRDSSEMADQRDKDCAFEFSVYLWIHGTRTRKIFAQLRDLTLDDAARSEYLAVTRRSLRFRRSKTLWFRIRNGRYTRGNYWYYQKSKLKHAYNQFRSCRALLLNLGKVRDGSLPGWIRDLCCEGSESRNRYIMDDLSYLETLYSKRVGRFFGKQIRKATELGCIKIWGTHTPDITRNTIIGIPGAVGIQTLWKKRDLNFPQFSTLEADRASRYALSEINGFPPWFPDLVDSQPKAVRGVFVEQIISEWFYHDENCYFKVLYQLDRDDEPLTALLSPVLTQLLLRNDPELFKVLELTTLVLTRVGSLSEREWARLARERCDRYEPKSDHFTLWLSVWIQTDAMSALTFIEALREPFFTENRQSNFVVALCSQLVGRHGRGSLKFRNPDHLNPENVERWVRCVYQWVCEDDDIHRQSGECYSPTDRDDAQFYRGNLLADVADLDDPSVDHILDALSNDPEFSKAYNYLEYLREKRAKRFADREAWSERQFRQFADDREADPTTSAGLFEIVLRRMNAIKHDVEDAEESIRDYFNEERNEFGLQSFLTRQLRERRNARYTAPRETEIDGQQRTDIQIHSPRVDGNIQVEVKLASMTSRSTSSLLLDMEVQLLGQYMRDRTSNFGIFALGLGRGRDTWKDPDSGRDLSFPDLIELLSRRAAELEHALGHAKRIVVIGIDFRERERRKSKSLSRKES